MRMDVSDEQRERLARLAGMTDAEIDTTDIPEVLDWSGAIRGGTVRPTRPYTTAVASISTSAAGSTSSVTPTTAIAG